MRRRNTEMETVRINPLQLAALTDYSELSGNSIDSLIFEALQDFLECAVSTRTEDLAERTAQA
jgi:hypothetical protein